MSAEDVGTDRRSCVATGSAPAAAINSAAVATDVTDNTSGATRIVPIAIVEPVARDLYEVPVTNPGGNGDRSPDDQADTRESPESPEEDSGHSSEEVEAEAEAEDAEEGTVDNLERFLEAGERGEIQPLAREEILGLLDTEDTDSFTVNHGVEFEDE